MFKRYVRHAGWYVDAARLLVGILFGADRGDPTRQAPRRW